MSGKVLDSRLPHRIAEWARAHASGSTASERDADAIVTWLRSQRGSDYARKPADGLRRQVLKVIGLQVRAAASATTTEAGAEWSIDPTPEPNNLASQSAGTKRPSENGSNGNGAVTVPSKAARVAAAATTSSNGASNGSSPVGFNLLNASLRAARSN